MAFDFLHVPARESSSIEGFAFANVIFTTERFVRKKERTKLNAI
jgi:hypothetical protein